MNVDTKKKYEEDILKLTNRMSPAHKYIMFKFLYNEGNRMIGIDEKINKIKEYIELVPEKQEEFTNPYAGLFIV